ncbi:hypothetical protein [Thermoflavimicrobium dichotomicum]|uniref:Glycosyl transferase family 2 n=1 Tax=Thermoflavimicrobium dichotomicum TaxID=46223 RepID=A0A1I3JY28_9BACL|nr:hypothetical protein [Thermoflavimicrobium dichotomicum]SFI65066.1 hypothetical protein SAMN05421852_101249 [Thermoflavimicrobium dichotomicum]
MNGQWVLFLEFLVGGIVFLLLVHFILKFFGKRFGRAYRNKADHLVIITGNNQQSIERVVWSYYFWNRFRGNPGRITCLDMGSLDDTLIILQKLKQKYPGLRIVKIDATAEDAISEWIQSQEQGKEKILVIDLREIDASKERYLA